MEPVIAGHPLHPVLVTLPVGLWSSSYVLDLLALTTGNDSFADAAYYNMAMGLAGSLPSAVSGYLDYLQMEKDDPAHNATSLHRWINVGVMNLYSLNILLRRKNKKSKLGLLLSTIGTAGLVVSGYLGGEIAYGRGWRVRSAERFELEWQKEHEVGPFAPKNSKPTGEKYPPEVVKGFNEKRSGEPVLKEIQQNPAIGKKPAAQAVNQSTAKPAADGHQPDPTDRPSQAEGDRDTIDSDLKKLGNTTGRAAGTAAKPAASSAPAAPARPAGMITQPTDGENFVQPTDVTDKPSQAEGDRDTVDSDLQDNSPS